MSAWLPRALIGVGLLAACDGLQAATYRCDDRGRITYSDVPCTAGRPAGMVEPAAAPSADDRAAAEVRQRADRDQLDAWDRTRERERRQDQQAAALAARRNASRGKEVAACDKLASRAKRASEEFERAGPRERSTWRTRLRRAEDDFAALCRKR